MTLAHLPLGMGLEGCTKANRIVIDEGSLFPTAHIVDQIKANYSLMQTFVKRHPEYACTDFSGNYCLLTLPKNMIAKDVTNMLTSQGVYVAAGDDFPEPNSRVLRVHTGGPPEHIERLCDLLTK